MSWAHWSSAWTATTSTSVNPPSILGLTPTNTAVKQPTTSQDIPDEIVKRADAFLQDLSDELGLAFGRPTSQHPSPSPKTQQAKPNHASPPRNPSYLETQRLDSEIETLQPKLSHLQSPKSHLTTAAGAKTKPIRLRPEVVRHLIGGPRHSQLVALEGLQWITPPSRDEPGYFKDHRGKTWEIRPADEGGRGMDGDGKRERPPTPDRTLTDVRALQNPRKRARANTPADPTPAQKHPCPSTRAHVKPHPAHRPASFLSPCQCMAQTPWRRTLELH